MEKRALTKLVDDTFAGWEALIAELGDEGLERPGACGNWRVRDVLAHITGWDRWNIAQVRIAFTKNELTMDDITGGIEYGTEMDGAVTEDQRNAAFYKANRDRLLRAVLQDWRDVSREQVEWVAGATQEQIDAPVGLVWGERIRVMYLTSDAPEATNVRPAAEWLVEQIDHRREHLDAVRAWMSQPA
jgi:mycothiol maleylpyruvate isomerase-like protein